MVTFIWIILGILTCWFSITFVMDFLKHKDNLEKVSWLKTGLIGFFVNFIDVLGIGAFAPQTALLKFTGQTEDKLLPGTLNVANTIPVLIQAIIFITVIKVEPIIITAGFMVAVNMEWIKGGGTAIGLSGYKLVFAIAVNFLLGALMTAGIGLYAPCMAMVFSLGLSPQVAFPIMMGSCAFLMPPASIKFIKEGAYNRKAAFSMAIPGIVAVFIAAFIVKSLPLESLRWLVIVVILYTAILLLRAFKRS